VPHPRKKGTDLPEKEKGPNKDPRKGNSNREHSLSSIWHFPMIVVDKHLLPNSRPKVKNTSFGMFVDASKAPIENI